jgi:hypothetical protein
MRPQSRAVESTVMALTAASGTEESRHVGTGGDWWGLSQSGDNVASLVGWPARRSGGGSLGHLLGN